MTKPHQVCFVFGTRPEAIKVAPVIAHLRTLPQFEISTIVTAQHREMLDQMVEVWDLPVTRDLNVMTPDQSLESLTAKLCDRVGGALRELGPDCVIVQGDTTSVFIGALCAFYQDIAVGHLEAGLRTPTLRTPFPEEMNRRLTSTLTDYHFAPTVLARRRLLAEGVRDAAIWVTGNSGIDALRIMARRPELKPTGELANALARAAERIITVTSHRRENIPFMVTIGRAIAELLAAHRDTCVVFPIHLSPRVRAAFEPVLKGVERCDLIEPLPYDQFVLLMKRSYLLLTDSGGLQEEGPHLGKPVLVMRRVTERPEAVEAGTVRLVGDAAESIVSHADTLLRDRALYVRMSRAVNPYGDGHTSERVGRILDEQLTRRREAR